jgi:8-oxo-dGTP diphosphatase
MAGRDRRTNVVSVAYLAVVREIPEPEAGGDAKEARLWPVRQALELELAFDHQLILRDAIERARVAAEQSDLAVAFVGPLFTLTQLRGVYEKLWDTELDAANFRRALMSPDGSFVEPTGLRAESGPEGGRRPELFRSTPKWREGSPVKRSRRRTTE